MGRPLQFGGIASPVSHGTPPETLCATATAHPSTLAGAQPTATYARSQQSDRVVSDALSMNQWEYVWRDTYYREVERTDDYVQIVRYGQFWKPGSR
jgi:hypothetical protein